MVKPRTIDMLRRCKVVHTNEFYVPRAVVKRDPEDFQKNIGFSRICLDLITNYNSMLLLTVRSTEL